MAEINNISLLENIKSKYIMKKIFKNLKTIKFLNIIRYNKTIKNRLDITLDDYKKYTEIEIKIDTIGYGKFINRYEDMKNIHIYFNGSEENIKDKTPDYATPQQKVKEIKIIIDYGNKS